MSEQQLTHAASFFFLFSQVVWTKNMYIKVEEGNLKKRKIVYQTLRKPVLANSGESFLRDKIQETSLRLIANLSLLIF